MSTWGGIGEGLTAGMNARIALEEQRRRERIAQANADREFAFKHEQANRTQTNADRTFEAGREDAANAQANADRTFSEGVRRADMTQANADRDFSLKQYDAALKTDIASAENERADEELAIKREAQDWSNATSEARLRGFQLANEKLDREERQAKMIEDAKRDSGRQQLATAIYRVTGSGGEEKTISLNENGQQVQKKVRVLPQSAKEQIFGKDGYFRDVQNVIAYEDENGNTVAALVKPDGTMQQFTPEQQYDIYGSAFGKTFADEQMRGVADKRELGMFTAKESAKAIATGDAGGMRSINSLLQTAVKEGLFTDEEGREVAQYALNTVRKRNNGSLRNNGGTEGSRIAVPTSAYTRVGQGRYRDGSVKMQNGVVIRNGQSVDTPKGTLVNENGTVYLISK